MQLASVDFMEFSKYLKGNINLLEIAYYFSKFVILQSFLAATADKVAKLCEKKKKTKFSA